MKIAICDDEKEQRDIIFDMVAYYFKNKNASPEYFLFSDGEDLLAADECFDIAFLDIEMNRLGGIETAKKLNEKSKRTIVFIVTAYQKYLDDAMDLNVFRYIDKPVRERRLYAGLDKALEFIDNNEIGFETSDNEIVKIHKNDIMCVEVKMKKVYVTTEQRTYVTREKMDFFKENLTASYFAVPHNSYIVNLNFVTGFKREALTLKNGASVAVAPKKQMEIRKKFMSFLGDGYGSL